MRSSFNYKIILSSIAIISTSAFAENSKYFKVHGSHNAYITLKNINYNINKKYDLNTLTGIKVIKLMSINPTKEMVEKNKLALIKMNADGGEKDYSNGITPFDQSPGAVDLGMSNTPVLDQGSHGTCVTFATTAILDAKLNKGDYIDQQCILALNKGLGNDYWNGAENATQILDPLKTYGIIPKDQCFDTTYADPDQTISTTKYQEKSSQSYSNNINYTFLATAGLDEIKTALKAKHRVIIGTAIADISGDSTSVNGFDMTIGDNQTNGGLWACQQPSSDTNYCGMQNAGHEVIIIGYDDKQQLLKIRNSWSDQVGDQGNYYMTYSFFNAMVSDQTEID